MTRHVYVEHNGSILNMSDLLGYLVASGYKPNMKEITAKNEQLKAPNS